MKFALVLCAILGASLAVPTKDLGDDFSDFWDLVDTEAIRAVVRNYVANDRDVQTAVTYLQGSDWKDLVATIKAYPEVQNFAAYLNEAGLDIGAILAVIRETIDGITIPSQTDASLGGIPALWAEVKALLPIDAWKDLFYDKLENDAQFGELIEKVKSSEAQALAQKVLALEAVQELGQKLRALGIDVDALIERIKDLLGWN